MSTNVHNPRRSGPTPAKKTPGMHARARAGFAVFLAALAMFGIAALYLLFTTGAYWPMLLAGTMYWLCASFISP